MPNTKSLLVPVNPDGCAELVVSRATELATSLGARMTLLVVVNAPSGVHPGDLSHGDTVKSNLQREAEARLEELASLARPVVPRVDTVVRYGDVVDTVLNEVAAQRPTMVVMGTHGRTGLRRVLLGSVAESVIRRATVPVVVVHAPEGTPDHQGRAYTQASAEAEG